MSVGLWDYVAMESQCRYCLLVVIFIYVRGNFGTRMDECILEICVLFYRKLIYLHSLLISYSVCWFSIELCLLDF